MAIKCFVEAIKKYDPKRDLGYDRPDRIPGTNKVRTYVGNDSIYSKESDIETIIANELRARGISNNEE